jgi:hypothetical protein
MVDMTLIAAQQSPATIPTGWYPFGWHGIGLQLPQEWNLARHEGDARRGALVFSDLHGACFTLRWHAARRRPPWRTSSPERDLAKTLQRLRNRAEIEPLAGGRAFRVLSALPRLSPSSQKSGVGRTLTLLADSHRVYEIELHERGAEAYGQLLEALLRELAAPTVLEPTHSTTQRENTRWFWSVFGAQGWVPAWSRLRRASFLPGETALEFSSSHGARDRLESRSLADRLLSGRPLRAWANRSISLVFGGTARNFGKSAVTPDTLHWVEHDPRQLSCTWRSPRRWRLSALTHEIVITHDPEANRIHWTHHCEPVKNE